MRTNIDYANNLHKDGTVICFAGGEGAGTTTMALGVAAWIAKHSEGKGNKALKTCVVDLDPIGSSLSVLTGKTTPNALDVALSDEINEATVRKALVKDNRLDVSYLLSPKLAKTVDLIPVSKYREIVDVLRTMFDVVILDTMTDSTNEASRFAYDMADRLVYVFRYDRVNVARMLRWVYENIDKVESDKVRLVSNYGAKSTDLLVSEIRTAIKTTTDSAYAAKLPDVKSKTYPRYSASIPTITDNALASRLNEERPMDIIDIKAFEDCMAHIVNATLPNNATAASTQCNCCKIRHILRWNNNSKESS